MRTWLLVSVLFAASCSFAKANPEYCESNNQCPTTGSFCDPMRHLCVMPSAALVLGAVEPPIGLASGGTAITLRGQNFREGMTVLINDLPTGATAVSAEGDSATTVAPFSNGVCGPVKVRVTNPDGESTESDTLFRYKVGTVGFTVNSMTTVNTAASTVSVVAVANRSSGWNDLVALNSGVPSTLKVMQVGPTGQFGTSTSFAATAIYTRLLTANLNNDDYPDLLALRVPGGSAVSLWLGGPANTFTESLILSAAYLSAATIELNQDGLEDLVLNGQTNLGVFRNASTAGTTAFSQVTGNQPNGTGSYLAVSQLDADSNGDVAIADNMGMLAVNFSDGNFGFAPALNVPTGLGSAGYMTTTDIDQDGRPDIILIEPPSKRISIIRNLGNRTFALPVIAVLKGQPDLIAVADVDCDGLPDLIYAQRGSAIINIQRNLGATPYFDMVQLTSVTAPDNIAVLIAARLDPDPLTDLAMLGTSPMQNTAYILRNNSQ